MNRVCPTCEAKDYILEGESLWPLDWVCPTCKFQIPKRSGFPLLSPRLADTKSGFDLARFATLFEIESKHFWFKSRNDLIAWLVNRFLGEASTFLEVGCGTGFVLSRLVAENHNIKFSGCEIHPTGMKYARIRLEDNVDFFQIDARKLCLEGCLDSIGSFDVIEHIDKDELVLANFYKALRDGGCVILTVPQHPFLWSQLDEIALHQRRYKRGELESKLRKAGFKILFSTSFTCLLFPAMALSRLLSKQQTSSAEHENAGQIEREFYIPNALNYLLGRINSFEVATIKWGMRWPVGGSRVVVARR